MKKKFSGQVQPISAVILTGIIIGLVGIAYAWGLPLIEKRASMSEFSSMEQFIGRLEGSIEELARSGGGEVDIEITGGSLKLLPYDSGSGNNSIVITFVLEQPLVFPNSTIYLGATSFEATNEQTGTYGEGSPSVVKMSSVDFGNRFQITAEIIYRELLRSDPPRRGYKIALCPKADPACSQELTGKNMITLSFSKNVVEPGMASNGGDLVTTYIDVRLS